MKEINYSYNPTRETAKRGITLSGMYSITKGKGILFTALCIFIIANSAYAMISTGKINLLHIIYIIFGVAILGYVWLLPNFIVNRKLNNVDETSEIGFNIKPSEIVVTKNGEEQYTVTARDFRGYQKGEDMFVVYHATSYTALPTENLSDDEVADLEEILKYFHNPDYFKTAEEKAADNQPEFPPFVPPEDFKPEEEQEESPKTIENEEA